ncbi:MAG: hypothetical protein N4A49_12460 [Marinifilaceae bacterium]|nr:hypothetical protein [Marinifilaceae bacterium]
MKNGLVRIILIGIVCFFVIRTCSMVFSSDSSKTYQTENNDGRYIKDPIDKLITKMSSIPNYSIILNDMDSEGDGSSAKYKHRYQILIPKEGKVEQELTGWEYVSPQYFQKNINNLGMELVSKKDYKLTKQAVPAGYNHYIGNKEYGHWKKDSSGNSFWEFYGKYAFMSSMLNLVTFPARQSYWNDYYRGGYYGSSRPYYGPRGNTVYGTSRYASSPAGKSSTWGSKPNSFKTKVRNNVSKSASAAKYSNKKYSTKSSGRSSSSGRYSSSSSRSSSSGSYSRTSRSSSRYSRSSSRSRSGGFGK